MDKAQKDFLDTVTVENLLLHKDEIKTLYASFKSNVKLFIDGYGYYLIESDGKSVKKTLSAYLAINVFKDECLKYLTQ